MRLKHLQKNSVVKINEYWHQPFDLDRFDYQMDTMFSSKEELDKWT